MFSTTEETKTSKPIAVVTASTAGIGLAIADSLLSDGYYVIISSRKQDNVNQAIQQLEQIHGGSNVSGMSCHVGKQQDRINLFEYAISKSVHAKIDALILNAAVSTTYGPILETSEANWDKMFDINIKSSFLLIKQFQSHLTNSIIFISSIAAYSNLPGIGVYSITKTALLGLTKVLATELAPKGIRVNSVAPGIIKTNFSQHLWKSPSSLGQKSIQNQNYSKSKPSFFIPLKRLGYPQDVGGVVAFLVSDKAAYITGENIVVAGGAMSKL